MPTYMQLLATPFPLHYLYWQFRQNDKWSHNRRCSWKIHATYAKNKLPHTATVMIIIYKELSRVRIEAELRKESAKESSEFRVRIPY